MELLRRVTKANLQATPVSDVLSQVMAVDEQITPGSVYPLQRLKHLCMFLTESGTARVRVGDVTVSHRPGSMVLIARGASIDEEVGKGSNWHVKYLMLAGRWASSMSALLERHNSVYVYDPAPARWQRRFRETVDLLMNQTPGWDWLFLSALTEFAGVILRHPSPAGEPLGVVEKLERLIDQAPERSWKLDELCRALQIRRSTLSHRFKDLTGESLARWICRRRIAIAGRMLRQGMSVVKTSEQMGFANPFHFSRVFKSVAGVSPSQVRSEKVEAPLHRSDSQA
jgi:AraC-like DNA-binding protein